MVNSELPGSQGKRGNMIVVGFYFGKGRSLQVSWGNKICSSIWLKEVSDTEILRDRRSTYNRYHGRCLSAFESILKAQLKMAVIYQEQH